MPTSQQGFGLWIERLQVASDLLVIIGCMVIAIALLAGMVPLIYAVGIPVVVIAAAVVQPLLGARVHK